MPGVAAMTANMLTQGTEKRSAQEIAEAIDFVGGSLTAEAGKDSTIVSLNVVKKDLQTGFDLMSDVVLHPAFQSEELERQRQQLLSNLTVQYSDPDFLASVAFSRVVYGGSPYGLARGRHSGHGEETGSRTTGCVPQCELRAESGAAGAGGRHHAGGSVCRGRKIFRRLGQGGCGGERSGDRRGDERAAHLADRQAGRGADANSRGGNLGYGAAIRITFRWW